MATLTLFPGFARGVSFRGESVPLGSKRVYWSGIGKVYLEYLNADDSLNLTGPNGVFNHTFETGCGPLQPAGPFDITNIFVSGANDISATVADLCGGTIGVWDINITGDISFTPPCIPTWQCEPGQTGYDADGCGNRRANPACAYTEAVLASCQWPANVIAGQAYPVLITVNQGSMTENYKIVFSGDYVGESPPFIVNTGTGQQQFTIGNLIFTTAGQKNITANLVKV